MEIVFKVTHDENGKADLKVIADNQTDGIVFENNRADFGIKKFIESDYTRTKVLERSCQKILNYINEQNFKSILFDINSFSDGVVKVSYIMSVLSDELEKSYTKCGGSEIIVYFYKAMNIEPVMEKLSAITYNKEFVPCENFTKSDFSRSLFMTNYSISDTYCTDLQEHSDNAQENNSQDQNYYTLLSDKKSYPQSGYIPYDELQDEFQKNLKSKDRHALANCINKFMNLKGLTSPEVYKAGGISKQNFNKAYSLKNNVVPLRSTIAALAIGLRLDIEEAETLYEAAGYKLSDSYFEDIALRYFIAMKIYDIDTINECMYYNGYPNLGARNIKKKTKDDFEKD